MPTIPNDDKEPAVKRLGMTKLFLIGTGLLAPFGVLVALMFGLLALLAITFVPEERTPAACEPNTDEDAAVEIPTEYQQALEAASADSGIDIDILAAQIDQESGWNPDAVSGVGAQGLTQFMPGTWSEYGDGDPFNPEDSIAAQGRYMAALVDEVEEIASTDHELIELVLAAYNAGPAAVSTHDGIPPFTETQNYVTTITSNAGEATVHTGGCQQAMSVEGVGDDDYPYREPIGRSGFGMDRTIFNHTQRECTDFVMWRINQTYGYDHGDGDPTFSFSTLGVGYTGGQSGAGSWVDVLTAVDGIEFIDSDPEPGDIAWWGYNDIGGGYGHVGWVAETDGDTAVVEHYNYSQSSTYSVTEEDIDEIPGYIRITDDFEL